MSIREFGRIGISIWLPKKTRISSSGNGTVLKMELPYPMDEISFFFSEDTMDITEFREQIIKVLDEMIAARISKELKQ